MYSLQANSEYTLLPQIPAAGGTLLGSRMTPANYGATMFVNENTGKRRMLWSAFDCHTFVLKSVNYTDFKTKHIMLPFVFAEADRMHRTTQ